MPADEKTPPSGNGDKPAEKNALAPEAESIGEASSVEIAEPPAPQDLQDLPPAPPFMDPKLQDPHKTHNKDSVLPGHNGLPFRGPVPNLKDSDPVQPEVANQVFVHVLNLTDKEDLKTYQKICQMVGNGYAQISFEEREYDKEAKNWRVLIRWMLLYTHMPREAASLFM